MTWKKRRDIEYRNTTKGKAMRQTSDVGSQ